MTCHASANIAAPCQQGHAHDGPVHCVGEIEKTGSVTTAERGTFWCKDHCPKCGVQARMEWTEPVKTITGSQEGLF